MRDPTKRFSDRVDNYVKYRPSYPAQVIDFLHDRCGLSGSWVVVDVGSGPGNLSRLFLDNGNRVIGIEPNREMREAGELLLARYASFTSIDGTAEATTLDDRSVELVTAGQAFHWFHRDAARREFERILSPPRWVALVWNERRAGTTPFLAAYEELLLQFGTDYRQVEHRTVSDSPSLDIFFGETGYEVGAFVNEQIFDYDGVQGRLLSSSYAPGPGDRGHEAMLEGLRHIFDAHQSDGTVTFEYDTRVYLGQV